MASSDPSPAASARSSREGEMVVRVRDALFNALCEHLYDADGIALQNGRFFISGADCHIDSYALARAAIEAMREPSEPMIEAYCKAHQDLGFHAWANASYVLPRLIDAALADEASEPQLHDQQSAGDKSRERDRG